MPLKRACYPGKKEYVRKQEKEDTNSRTKICYTIDTYIHCKKKTA